MPAATELKKTSLVPLTPLGAQREGLRTVAEHGVGNAALSWLDGAVIDWDSCDGRERR